MNFCNIKSFSLTVFFQRSNIQYRILNTASNCLRDLKYVHDCVEVTIFNISNRTRFTFC